MEEAYEDANDGNGSRHLDSKPTFSDKPLEDTRRRIDVKALAKASLRGGNPVDRRLENTRFQLKLHHQDGYFWQESTVDPKWCMECDGRTCSEQEKLEIGHCDEDEDDQFFVYEPIQGTGGGRLKPYEDQDLCLMRTSDRRHTLEKCDDVNQGVDDRQILLGLEVGGAPSEQGRSLSHSTPPSKGW